MARVGLCSYSGDVIGCHDDDDDEIGVLSSMFVPISIVMFSTLKNFKKCSVYKIRTAATFMSLKTKVFDQCVLPVMRYGTETWSLTVGLIKRLKVTQRAMERAMLGVTRYAAFILSTATVNRGRFEVECAVCRWLVSY
jgi:hypothetical protein